jgi:hypothetical protein
MIGSLPSGLFGLTPGMMPQPGQMPPQAPPQAFQWGAGGAQVTPEQIAMQQKIALQNQQAGMDTSPVGSWTQGLARVAQALVGNMQARRADKLQSANQSATQQIMQSLLNPGASAPAPQGMAGQAAGGTAFGTPQSAAGGSGMPVSGGPAVGPTGIRAPGTSSPERQSALLAAIANPYIGGDQREALKLEFQAGTKDPKNDPESVRLSRIMNDPGQPQYVRDAAGKNLEVLLNPVVAMPGGGLSLRSDVVGSLGGGGQSSSVPTAPVGKLTPITGGAPSQGGATFR